MEVIDLIDNRDKLTIELMESKQELDQLATKIFKIQDKLNTLNRLIAKKKVKL
jgi:hypothetical protein